MKELEKLAELVARPVWSGLAHSKAPSTLATLLGSVREATVNTLRHTNWTSGRWFL